MFHAPFGTVLCSQRPASRILPISFAVFCRVPFGDFVFDVGDGAFFDLFRREALFVEVAFGFGDDFCWRLFGDFRGRADCAWLPAGAEVVDGPVHRLGLACADAGAAHGVVEHAVHVFPRFLLQLAGRVVEDRGVAERALERAADDGPEQAGDRRAVDHGAGRGEPLLAVRVDVGEVAFERHVAAVVAPGGGDVADEVAEGPVDGIASPPPNDEADRQQE